MSSDAIQALISCRLDYCNSLFYGITDGLMSDELAATILPSGKGLDVKVI